MAMPSEREPVRHKPNPAEAELWATRLRSLPDVRWEKVMRVRRTLNLNTYETDGMLEAVLAPLANELGVLSRGEQPGEPV